MGRKSILTRIGETAYNKTNDKMIIIDYIDANNIQIKFDNGFIINGSYKNFKKGEIRNPYYKSIFGVGFLGEGKYNARINNKVSKRYKTWTHMLQRCYDIHSYDKQHTYANCSVIKEWHNYQNFAKWYEENFYQIPNETMCIDKDILIKGNKIYSPETCVFVPQKINNLFTKDDAMRGKYVIGVTKDKSDSYRAQYNINGEITYLGAYKTPEKAFLVYKLHKEKLIKQIAEQYKNNIPQKLYNAMYKYEVEVTD